MDLILMSALSLLLGIVAAGFVWYGWNLWENLNTARQNFGRFKNKSDNEEIPEDEIPKENAEEKVE